MSGFISNLFSNATQQPQNHVPVEQGDVMLTVDGKTVKTWGALRITRSLRKFSDYEVSLAEVWPNDPTKISLKPQQQVQIKIGKDKVLTGYVERYNASGSPGEHDIQIQGRSRCCDLQDCNIETSVQSSNIDILDFAKKLCAPFGKPPPINVSIVGNANPTRYPYINIDLTQTPKELICLVAAYSQMIVYDDVNGDLVLATVGAGTMGSGVQQGVNVDHWGVQITSDRRFSVYVAVVH
jgi:prophage tail gpP-like protein